MKVEVQHEEGLSGAERLVVRWLRTWTGQYFMPGVVVANVNVPAAGGSRQVDMIVFSPYGCITVEIKGFTRRQDGHLLIPTNGPWTVDGEPAALHTAKGSNPLEQVRTNLFAVKDALGTAGQQRYVSGLVIVVPAAGAALSVGPSPSSGIDVVLGELIALRDYFHRLEKRPMTWHVDDAAAAAQALDLTYLVPDAKGLAAEGFQPAEHPVPTPASWEPSVEPTPPVYPQPPASDQPTLPGQYQYQMPSAATAVTYQQPIASLPRRRGTLSRTLAGVFTGAALLLALLVLLVHLNTSGPTSPGIPPAPPSGTARPHPVLTPPSSSRPPAHRPASTAPPRPPAASRPVIPSAPRSDPPSRAPATAVSR